MKTRYQYPIGPEFSLIHIDKEIKFLDKSVFPKFIGFSGPTKVGKSQIAKYIIAQYGLEYLNMSAELRNIANNLGFENPSHDDLMQLSEKIRKNSQLEFLAIVAIKRILENRKPFIGYVIDGILHPSEINLLSLTLPDFYSVYFWAEDELRIKGYRTWQHISKNKASIEINLRDRDEQVNSGNDIYKPILHECRNIASDVIKIPSFDNESLFVQSDCLLRKIGIHK